MIPAATTSTPDGIAGWALQVMDALGAPGLGLLVALENLFPPIPSEVILPLGGFAVHEGSLGLLAVLAWATLGSVVGAWALYGIGAKLGRDRVLALVDRMPLIDVDIALRAEDIFARHGRAAVFWGRLLPGVRSLVSVPAGLTRMPFWQFTLYTAVGSLLWNCALVGAGYALGTQWHRIEGYVGVLQWVVVGVVVVLFVRAAYRWAAGLSADDDPDAPGQADTDAASARQDAVAGR